MVQAGDTVAFHGIVLNEGGHYDASQNSFICPHDGIYLVTVNIQVINGTVAINLKKEAEQILYLFNHKEMPLNVVSNAAVTHCLKGEALTVVVYHSKNAVIGGSAGTPLTTFTVMKLKQKTGTAYLIFYVCKQ